MIEPNSLWHFVDGKKKIKVKVMSVINGDVMYRTMAGKYLHMPADEFARVFSKGH